ncbi:MAG: hypothetical protein AAFU41_11595 [Pseudomonadota bacterium]
MPTDAIGSPTPVSNAVRDGMPSGANAASKEAWAAQEFEAVFLTQAIDEMLKTVKIGSMGGGHAEETWRGFLAKSIADEIAQSGVTNISGGVTTAISAYGELSPTQGDETGG